LRPCLLAHLLFLVFFRYQASEARSGGLRCGGRQGLDRLVDDVSWLQDVVNYAVAIVFLARALVDTPVAIDDKLVEC
jgi:hypothetical protein